MQPRTQPDQPERSLDPLTGRSVCEGSPTYEYLATVERIVDGDTIDFAVDVGFHLTMRMRIRLAGVDASELRGPQRRHGLSSKAFVEQAIPIGSQVLVRTYKLGKYGRFIADVAYVPKLVSPDVDTLRTQGIQLAEALVQAGLAKPAPRDP